MDGSIVVLVRLIRSFEYRNVKQLVVHVSSEMSVGDFIKLIHESLYFYGYFGIVCLYFLVKGIDNDSKFRSIRNYGFGMMKY